MYMLITLNKVFLRFNGKKQSYNSENVNIQPHELHSFHVKSRPMEIFSEEGLVYITQEGDPKDYLLATGERMIVRQPGVVIIEGYKNSRVRISQAAVN